ncbi:SDR family oxidoreductase [Prosthecochloris sp.]|uniref:SDR family NAD(P)-dependent oxidoreductase n=1 Tax=Prosthecochloris sp. TaxID=290513 RepID=UPI0025E3BF44|nr:SDR family oxidoreductase [Prosthecochloris sp.]
MAASEKKVCFITGGSGRLGSEIAISLAQKGYSIFFTYNMSRGKAEEVLDIVRAFAPESAMAQCNVSKVADIEKAFRTFTGKFKRLDLLIASASNFYSATLPDITESEWESLVDTNLKGTFFTMQTGARIMKKQSFVSRIITMTDISADLVWQGFAPYTASKTAVQHLTKVFAKAFAPDILVNSIAPGTVTINPEWNNGPEEELTKNIPLRRIGQPSDIMEAILFLTASSYVTGQVINVEGGRLLN